MGDETRTLKVDDDDADPPRPRGLIGRTLGRFTVVERLGLGGAGEVFLANDATLGRTAVIKVLRDTMRAAPNQIERFLREVQLASRLDHPYAAHIYGFGVEPDQTMWIAMEHVRGMTLYTLVRERGAMPVGVFAPLFGRLCEVIHSAHELGIVHRDIKDSNVMVIERSGQLLPKLLDFGIAKTIATADPLVRGSGRDGVHLTLEGSTLGTPLYMAPEQWQGASDIDHRADIYALGVLAYHCLAARWPFEHRDRNDLRTAHLVDAPPRLANVPAPLGAAVERALAKSPAERFPDALAFGEAVRAAVGQNARESLPVFETAERDAWLQRGPQPIADAIARLAGATTTIEADAALHELVAILCRWLAALALSTVSTASELIREHAREVVGSDASLPWLRLARAAAISETDLPGLAIAIATSDALAALAERLDARDRARSPEALAADVSAIGKALGVLEPLLRYRLVVGRPGSAESWQGPRRREHERVIVWGQLDDGEVALIDDAGCIVARLSPFVRVMQPLRSLEPELFLLWRAGYRSARLVAAPWGFEHDDDVLGERLFALTTQDDASSASPGRSPYIGLAPYSIGDADQFFGREVEVEALANRLVRTQMVAVLGASGVGKSSFLHAGLLPRLAEQWRIVALRPGRRPLQTLAAAITAERDRDAVVTRLRALASSAQRGVILAIDQLEELVTLCHDHDEQREFGEALALATEGSRGQIRVVATLRDDFASILEDMPAVRGRFEVFVLTNPSREGLRRIVTEPARRAGVTIQSSVVDAIVEESVGRPAALPLVSFVAARLWDTRDPDEQLVTHEAYVSLGGVGGALAAYADRVYESIPERERDAVRDLMTRLVGNQGTRVPVPRGDVAQDAVVRRLVDSRLIVVRDDAGTEAIEIVHECLADRWPRLARWRREDAADRALHSDIAAAARRWDDQSRSKDLLWRGRALRDVLELAARSSALTPIEREFAEASDRAARRARSVRRGTVAAVIAVLAAISAVAVSLGFEAKSQQAVAHTNRADAESLLVFMLGDLRKKLQPLGRLDVLDEVSHRAIAYYDGRTDDLSDAELGRRAVARRSLGDVLLPQGHAEDARREYVAALATFEKLVEKQPKSVEWRSELALCYSALAAALRAQGDATTALTMLRHSLAIQEGLAGDDPANAERQMRLADRHSDIGDVLISRTDTSAALAEYRKAFAIDQAVVAKAPASSEALQGVALVQIRIGDALQQRGDHGGALAEYRAYLATSQMLADQEPANTKWQVELLTGHQRVGDESLSSGDTAGAFTELEVARTIGERLVAIDPTNAYWQRCMSGVHDRLAHVYAARGRAADELAEYRAAVAIDEALAARDRSNTELQAELAVGRERIGQMLFAKHDLAGALVEYDAARAVFETLAARDPTNADFQRKLSVSDDELGELLIARGDLDHALARYRESAAIRETLIARDPSRVDYRRDLAASHEGIGDALLARKDPAGALAEYRIELAQIEAYAQNDPSIASRQVDLANAHEKVGDGLRATGDRRGAGAAYQRAQAIAKSLVARDSKNAEWNELAAELDHRLAELGK